MDKEKVTVERLEKALKQPLRPLIVQLLKETQSPYKAADRLTELSGITVDYNALRYLRLKLRIDTKTKMVVK